MTEVIEREATAPAVKRDTPASPPQAPKLLDRQAEADRARIAALESEIAVEEARFSGLFEQFSDAIKRIAELEKYAAKRNNQALDLQDQLAAANQRIAELETRLSGQTCFVPPEFQNALGASEQRVKELEAIIRSHGIPVKTATGGQAHYCVGNATNE